MFAVIAHNIHTNEFVVLSIDRSKSPEAAEVQVGSEYFRAHIAAGDHILTRVNGQLELQRIEWVRGWARNYQQAETIYKIFCAQVGPGVTTLGTKRITNPVKIDQPEARTQGTTVRIPVFTEELRTFDMGTLRAVPRKE